MVHQLLDRLFQRELFVKMGAGQAFSQVRVGTRLDPRLKACSYGCCSMMEGSEPNHLFDQFRSRSPRVWKDEFKRLVAPCSLMPRIVVRVVCQQLPDITVSTT